MREVSEEDNDVLHYIGLASAILSCVCLAGSNVMYNYDKKYPRRSTLPFFTMSGWRQVHAVSQFIFMTLALGGTLTELVAGAILGKYDAVHAFIPYVDHFLALPVLALASVSGALVARQKYRQTTRNQPDVPRELDLSMNTFLGWALYYAITDKITQFAPLGKDNLGLVFKFRCITNIGSCAIAFYQRSLMFRLAEKGRSKKRG
jgi:ABC-type dipeptide/oligopeptide/nickel transport system permease subunit